LDRIGIALQLEHSRFTTKGDFVANLEKIAAVPLSKPT
jgi:hypothetical protein